MDSVSETLKQSEPCSPSSPASQDPLQRLHVANIQFNNLDIIANQETIVELKFDKTFKRRLNYGPSLSESTSTLVLKVTFELPIFVIRLQNEINQALIEISFRDFNVNFEKNNQYETNFQISLRSILMEDLLCPVEIMVTSSSPDSLIGGSNVFLSHSCPNFADVSRFNYEQGSSLPNNFDDRFLFFNQKYRNIQQSTIYPGTPPPSPQPKPRQDNLKPTVTPSTEQPPPPSEPPDTENTCSNGDTDNKLGEEEGEEEEEEAGEIDEFEDNDSNSVVSSMSNDSKRTTSSNMSSSNSSSITHNTTSSNSNSSSSTTTNSNNSSTTSNSNSSSGVKTRARSSNTTSTGTTTSTTAAQSTSTTSSSTTTTTTNSLTTTSSTTNSSSNNSPNNNNSSNNTNNNSTNKDKDTTKEDSKKSKKKTVTFKNVLETSDDVRIKKVYNPDGVTSLVPIIKRESLNRTQRLLKSECLVRPSRLTEILRNSQNNIDKLNSITFRSSNSAASLLSSSILTQSLAASITATTTITTTLAASQNHHHHQHHHQHHHHHHHNVDKISMGGDKKFILPKRSLHSCRVIKPNKRFLDGMDDISNKRNVRRLNKTQTNDSANEVGELVPVSNNAGQNNNGDDDDENEEEDDDEDESESSNSMTDEDESDDSLSASSDKVNDQHKSSLTSALNATTLSLLSSSLTTSAVPISTSPVNTATSITAGKFVLRQPKLQFPPSSNSEVNDRPFSTFNISNSMTTGGVNLLGSLNSAISNTTTLSACRICGTTSSSFGLDLNKRKYGIISCEACRKFISKMIKKLACNNNNSNLSNNNNIDTTSNAVAIKTENENSISNGSSTTSGKLMLECSKKDGTCIIMPLIKNLNLRLLRKIFKERCHACWLKKCLKLYQLPPGYKTRLVGILPENMRDIKPAANNLFLPQSQATNAVTNKIMNPLIENNVIFGSTPAVKPKIEDLFAKNEQIATNESSVASSSSTSTTTTTTSVVTATPTPVTITNSTTTVTTPAVSKRQRIDLKGPRVKHVCRSASIVLGQPIATFESQTTDSPISDIVEDTTSLTGEPQITMEQEDIPEPTVITTSSTTDIILENSNSNTSLDISSLELSKNKIVTRKFTRPGLLSSSASVMAAKRQQSAMQQQRPQISIDFWENYDPAEINRNGFGIILTEGLPIPALCFLCGSLGKDKLIFCVCCCEPYHKYCIEDEYNLNFNEIITLNNNNHLNWLCPRCTVCYNCNMSSGSKIKCNKCNRNYHLTCLNTNKKLLISSDRSLICSNCLKCTNCNAPNVTKFIGNLPTCNDCYKMKQLNNFCPICNKHDSGDKIMECGHCRKWIHIRCEGITDEQYNILSGLSESIKFICKKCIRTDASLMGNNTWYDAVLNEFRTGLLTIIKMLSKSQHGTLLLKISPRKKVVNCTCQPVVLANRSIQFSGSEITSSQDAIEFNKCYCRNNNNNNIQNLIDIKKKINSLEYYSIYDFNYDMQIIINALDCEDLMVTYKEVLSEIFPWFQNETKACTDALVEDMYDSISSSYDDRTDLNGLLSDNDQEVPNMIDVPENCSEYFYSNDFYKNDTRTCVLCKGTGDGASNMESRLLYSGHNTWIHINCALWSAEVFEEIDGSLQNVHTAISRGRLIKCSHCNTKGATVGCNVDKCGEHYHYPCARNSECVFLLNKAVYCKHHKAEYACNANEVEQIFEINRPVYVELDRKKKKMSEPNKVQFLIGSLSVKKLGRFVAGLSDNADGIIPSEFFCTRLYWSTKEPWKIVEYNVKISIHFNNNYAIGGSNSGVNQITDTGINFTVDHSNSSNLVKLEMAQITKWHNSLINGDEFEFYAKPDDLNQTEEEPQNNGDLLPPEIKDAIFEDLPHDLLDGISMLDILPKLMTYEDLVAMDMKNEAYFGSDLLMKDGKDDTLDDETDNNDHCDNNNSDWNQTFESEALNLLNTTSRELKRSKSEVFSRVVSAGSRSQQRSCSLTWNCKLDSPIVKRRKVNMFQELKIPENMLFLKERRLSLQNTNNNNTGESILDRIKISQLDGIDDNIIMISNPVKCDRCHCTYRSHESYQRHLMTCEPFSSTSESESETTRTPDNIEITANDLNHAQFQFNQNHQTIQFLNNNAVQNGGGQTFIPMNNTSTGNFSTIGHQNQHMAQPNMSNMILTTTSQQNQIFTTQSIPVNQNSNLINSFHQNASQIFQPQLIQTQQHQPMIFNNQLIQPQQAPQQNNNQNIIHIGRNNGGKIILPQPSKRQKKNSSIQPKNTNLPLIRPNIQPQPNIMFQSAPQQQQQQQPQPQQQHQPIIVQSLGPNNHSNLVQYVTADGYLATAQQPQPQFLASNAILPNTFQLQTDHGGNLILSNTPAGLSVLPLATQTQQPQVIGTLLQPQATTIQCGMMATEQMMLGSTPTLEMVTDPTSGCMYLTSQPVYYGLETIVRNTVMSSQQFVSTGMLSQNSSFSATTTQVFQASKIEPIMEVPTSYVVLNNANDTSNMMNVIPQNLIQQPQIIQQTQMPQNQSQISIIQQQQPQISIISTNDTQTQQNQPIQPQQHPKPQSIILPKVNQKKAGNKSATVKPKLIAKPVRKSSYNAHQNQQFQSTGPIQQQNIVPLYNNSNNLSNLSNNSNLIVNSNIETNDNTINLPTSHYIGGSIPTNIVNPIQQYNQNSNTTTSMSNSRPTNRVLPMQTIQPKSITPPLMRSVTPPESMKPIDSIILGENNPKVVEFDILKENIIVREPVMTPEVIDDKMTTLPATSPPPPVIRSPSPILQPTVQIYHSPPIISIDTTCLSTTKIEHDLSSPPPISPEIQSQNIPLCESPGSGITITSQPHESLDELNNLQLHEDDDDDLTIKDKITEILDNLNETNNCDSISNNSNSVSNNDDVVVSTTTPTTVSEVAVNDRCDEDDRVTETIMKHETDLITNNCSSSTSNNNNSNSVSNKIPAGPHILYEIQSEDGITYKSTSITEIWNKVFEAVQIARKAHGLIPLPEGPLDEMSGHQMLGLKTNALKYLLEQLPGVEKCTNYIPKYHKNVDGGSSTYFKNGVDSCPSYSSGYMSDFGDDDVKENQYEAARCVPFVMRSQFDMFGWLASRHRKQPTLIVVQSDNETIIPRRGSASNLPMAMRYRTLKETSRDFVGVYRSHIHGRGLFCTRDIEAGEMVIEYAGELIRSTLTDKREKYYDGKGIGCYMFKIDDNLVVDATMRGNAARFINHSCEPNCYSKVVDILGHKHIIIFALRRILQGEELTYDYKFPFEDEKIPCSCGSKRCRKYLN